MAFLKNLSIRSKLFLVSVIPSIGLIFFLYSSLSDSIERRSTAQAVYQDCERVERLSGLLDELQNERGYYLNFLASKASEDRDKISNQTALTDQAIMAVREVYEAHRIESGIFNGLDSIDFYRQEMGEHPEFLNTIKTTLIEEMYDIVLISRNPEIKNSLEAHLFLVTAKEYFARTKNILLPFFVNEDFQGIEFARFAERKGQYELSRDQFLLTASQEIRQYYKKTLNSQIAGDVEAKIDSLFVNPANVRLMTATDWWDRTATVLTAFAKTEKYSLLRIRERATAEVAAMNRNVLINTFAGLAIIMLIGFLVIYTIRQIVFSLSEIKSAAQKLAKGEVEFRVNVTTRDEVGDLANSFDQMVSIIREYAELAQKIGKGDYEVNVPVRGKSDLLGTALANMRDDLQRLSTETKVRTWLLTGNNRLNDSMRGEKELPVLSQEVITQLSEVLDAQIGALYVRENGHLMLAGKYAFTPRGDEMHLPLGHGVVGQAAAAGKHIVLTDVPDNYLKIQSALGDTKPKNILVYPFKYEGEVKGVLEIGSIKQFSSLDLELLDLVNEHIGIAINATQSREKLKELLEETQRQSEELETQQEELKQFNEELLEKTSLLQKSEEELKTQQEELQMSNEELVEKAALLAEQKQNLEFTQSQMEAKARELELASQYKSEFLSNMSHELRTPLNSILILAQVLMENRNSTMGTKEIQFANTIYNSGNDLLNLINDILDLSKIEAGKMDLDVAPFTIDALVLSLNNAFGELARSRKIKFSIRCAGKLQQRVLISDRQRIEQVLKNFLSNSLKFTPAGGKVELIISQPGADVVFRRRSLQQHADTMSFSVKDTGIGIPEEKLNIIFDAFQQVDGSTKRKYGGTGLGLSISRELANLLGGEIHVTSSLGAGSEFTLYLPAEVDVIEPVSYENTLTIHPPSRISETVQEPVSELPLADASHYDDQHLLTDGDRRILIMEDDVEFAKVLLEFVHERNYKGIIAHQGNIGLSYARHYKPDAIILDMKLPVIDGAEVLKKLKSDPDLRHIPVQIISGFDYRKSGLELGALDFIRKPISREAFWKALDKVENFVSRKPKKLLIIEDDKHHNKAVQELIGNGDVKCYSAYSGTEAYEMLSKTAFDCIIVDLGLPDMTGISFLEKIRENKELHRMPVIVYTGKDLTKEENAQLEKLASTVVLKTAFSHERLLDETTLFLHRVESNLPKEKQKIIRKLHKTDEVLKDKRVLIVDDDDRNVFSLLNALEPEGLKCLKAGNGREALDVLKKEKKIDLILMDVMMPEMDGFEATRVIRSMADFRKTPIIALTAKAMKDDREKCLAAGMSDYISKPLNVQQLLSLMRVWLYS